MPGEDLSKLKIEKPSTGVRPVKRKNLSRIIVALLIILVLAVLYSKGVLAPAAQVEATGVSLVYPSHSFTLLNASGYVVAQRKAAVASKITSRLVYLKVEEGDHVKKGDVIARLENEDAAAARDQAAANLEVARSNLEQAKAELKDASLAFQRSKELLSSQYISKSEYDASEARHNKAAAAVGSAQAAVKAGLASLQNADVSLEYTNIRAPFDAVVLTKNADIGDIVTPLGAAANAKASVVTIADMDSLQVEADVSEANLQQVRMGEPCEIQLDALPDFRFMGRVHMIVPTADRTKATVLVKISFIDKDKRILPEMSAKVAFLEREVKPDERKARVALNPSAITSRKGRKVAFLIGDNRVVETPVVTGIGLGDMVEVLSGLKPGDKVVLRPADKLNNGDKVRIIEK